MLISLRCSTVGLPETRPWPCSYFAQRASELDRTAQGSVDAPEKAAGAPPWRWTHQDGGQRRGPPRPRLPAPPGRSLMAIPVVMATSDALIARQFGLRAPDTVSAAPVFRGLIGQASRASKRRTDCTVRRDPSPLRPQPGQVPRRRQRQSSMLSGSGVGAAGTQCWLRDALFPTPLQDGENLAGFWLPPLPLDHARAQYARAP